MEIIEIKDHPTTCDRIQYSLKDEKLEYIDFFLNKQVVLMEIKNILTGLTIPELEYKIKFVTINPEVILILKTLLYSLKENEKKSKIKNKIFELHNKKKPE